MREMMASPPHNPVPASKDPFHERLPWFHMVGRASVSLNNLTRFLHDFLYTDKISLYIILLYMVTQFYTFAIFTVNRKR